MIELNPEQADLESVLATPVAPEDIRVGDFVASMNETMQYVFRACESDWTPADRKPTVQVVTARLVESMPEVVRVLAVALPFVLVEDRNGMTSLITCRLAELARLPEELGRRAMRDLDRRRRREAVRRRTQAAERRAKLDQPGAAGADGAD